MCFSEDVKTKVAEMHFSFRFYTNRRINSKYQFEQVFWTLSCIVATAFVYNILGILENVPCLHVMLVV